MTAVLDHGGDRGHLGEGEAASVDDFGRLEAFLRGWCDFPGAELAKARQVFRPAAVPRGALLTRAGERPDRVAFIVAGLVRLVYWSHNRASHNPARINSEPQWMARIEFKKQRTRGSEPRVTYTVPVALLEPAQQPGGSDQAAF